MARLRQRIQWRIEWLRQNIRHRRRILTDWLVTRFISRRKIVSTPLGFRLAVRGFAACREMAKGEFEPDEIKLAAELLKAADAFVDVGANVGLYTCLARSMGRPVVAIEPQRANLECLYASLSANGWAENVEVFPVALSSRAGLMTLYGASGPSASLLGGWDGYSRRYAQTVPTALLDTLLGNRFSGRRLLIKIDVEGAEYEVLQGASQILRAEPKPVWLVEVFFNECHPSGMNPHFAAVFETFWQNGYEAHFADARRTPVSPGDVKRWVETGRKDYYVYNYVFQPVGVRSGCGD